jgi:membrane-associated protease RseP (regulator of RpoE activity)
MDASPRGRASGRCHLRSNAHYDVPFVEWSEPNSGWDDTGDDPIYPRAPLPAHERHWRHPSEVGNSAWRAAEPPVAIGRGLMVATGAIGSVLGVAVLWLLAPAGAPAPSASPTATASVATLRPPSALATVAAPSATATTVTRSTAPVIATITGVTLPAPDVPSTVLVMSEPSPGHAAKGASIAVAIEGEPYIVTTANAVESVDDVSVVGPGDDADAPTDATVVSIDGQLAYLDPASALEVVSFSAVASAVPGQDVTVLGDLPIDISFAASGGIAELDPRIVVEGTPVVDADGALVALCTLIIDADGAYVDLVPVVVASDLDQPETATTVDQSGDDLAPTTTVEPTTTTSTATADPAASSTTTADQTDEDGVAWAGLRFDGAPANAPLTITGIAPGSPAELAGLVVGDRITALDDVNVQSIDEVLAAIKRHRPGDTLRVTVVSKTTASGVTNPSERTVNVVLDVYEPSV